MRERTGRARARRPREIKVGHRIRIKLLESGKVFEAILDQHLDSELPIQVTRCGGDGSTLILSAGEYEILRLDD